MFKSETEKILPKIKPYLKGKVIDIGAGHDKVTPDAFGVDARQFPHINYITNNLYDLHLQLPKHVGIYDVVYSSHTLEHIPDDIRAIKEWLMLLKKGGHIILYLPDDRWYDNESNPEHIRSFTYPQFLRFFKRAVPEAVVVESGEDFGDDRYSFYLVARKEVEPEFSKFPQQSLARKAIRKIKNFLKSN